MTDPKPSVVEKAKAELSFVTLHWGALSGVVVAAAVIGFIVARII
jgi:hypothetical protein